MPRALALLLLLAGCHHAGTDRVSVYAGSASHVVVTAHALPPGARVAIDLDVTYPHASVACNDAWGRTATVSGDGDATAVFDIAPTDDCALHDEMQAWITMPDGDDLRSRPFAVPQRTSR